MTDTQTPPNPKVKDINKKKGMSGVMAKVMPYVDALLDMPSKAFDLDENFGIVQLNGRTRAIVAVSPSDVLELADKDDVADSCMRYSKATRGAAPLEPKNATIATRYWRANAKPIPSDEISPVRQLAEDGYCWHRLPFNFHPQPTPTFDELFSRMSNTLAIKQWIGALFDPAAGRQNYVWIHGPGGQGKGALGRFLKKVFGPSYRAESPPDKSDKFWSFYLIGARLVVFADCANSSFVTTGICKSITGGDAIRVEEKGGKVGTAELCCMLLFLSNNKPDISSEVSDTRRIILSEIAPLPSDVTRIDDATYDALLWSEGAGFLAECREAYNAMRAARGGYSLDDGALDDVIAENEMHLSGFFDTYFELAPAPDKALKDRPYVSIKDFQNILRLAGKWTTRQQSDPFTKWLFRAHGIHSAPVKTDGGKQERRYVGAVLSRQGNTFLSKVDQASEF